MEISRCLENELGECLLKLGLTVATAESCTGGTIASLITSVAGSSEYYKGSVVSYSNDIKQRILGVSENDLRHHGAVSKVVVEQMALGVRCLMKTDCSVATSGIAGPGGGSVEKPVGTVWIAASYEDKLVSKCFHFDSNRLGNIKLASNEALTMLLSLLT